jgi:3-deoxy-D-manno-octulosonate 8-phosphate phosphatase (KDO 8-P phosphatase)
VAHGDVLDVPDSNLKKKAARIKLILFDIDGVLTDGRIALHPDGSESKSFFIRDGIAIVWAERAGLRVVLLSGRASPTTAHRAAQLGITLVHQGVADKLQTYETILTAERLSDAEVAYMGDDLVDLGVLSRVGLSAAPRDALREVRERVDWTSAAKAGFGAAREFVEVILRAQDRWRAIVASYLNGPSSAGAGSRTRATSPRKRRNR